MKKRFVQFSGLSIWAALGLFSLTNSASGEPVLENFRTETGKCTLTEKSEMVGMLNGFPDHSYTLDNTQIYHSRGFSQETGAVIPPLTRLNCLAKSARPIPTMLVTAANDSSPYCGWVKIDSLRKAKSESDLGVVANLQPCRITTQIPMNEFCAKMEKLGTPVSTCKTKQQNPTSENLSMTFPIKGKIIREYSKGKNDGIDMSGAAGGSVVAAADGTIAAITADADHVPIMVIKHRNDLLTVYANIYNIKLTKGDTVRRGQKIAELPTQAPVSIHFEVRKGFNSINPMDFLE